MPPIVHHLRERKKELVSQDVEALASSVPPLVRTRLGDEASSVNEDVSVYS